MQISHSYTYDALYRLTGASGTYIGADNKSASYTLNMGYDNMHRITQKSQHLSQVGVQFDGTLYAGYDLTYTYGSEKGKKFQLDNVYDINYRTEETPTESTNINNGHKYTYDLNGNLVYVNTSRVKRDGKKDEKSTEQKFRWDEENRLLAVDENGYVSNYWYDANGERTVKESGGNEAVYVNSEFAGGRTNTTKFSLYVSPYFVATQGGRYTKHIYIGSQRIVSKLGDLASYGADPRRIPYAGDETDGLTINYKDKYAQQLQSIKDNYKTFDIPYTGKDNNDYVNGQGFCCDDGTPEAAQARAMARASIDGNFKPNEEYEKMQFYYHPDHLGSSSYITNLDGEVSQHIEYVPFGEVFIEERNNSWNTPYLFNAKELDEETGMYYYGARYYDPRLSVWMSVDPLLTFDPHNEENYIEGEHNGGVFNNYNLNPYSYCYQNPVILTDPNGKQVFFQECINKLRRHVARGILKATEIVCIYAIRVAPTIAKANIENRLNRAVEDGEAKKTSLALTAEFVMGLGPEERTFSSSHPFAQSLKESNMTTVALKAYYKGYKEYLDGKRKDIPTSYRVDFGLLGSITGDTGPIQEYYNDGKFTAAQFVGTANYRFKLDANNNLHVTVEDTKTEYSFLYHLPGTDRHSRNNNRFMGETRQTYHFVITMQEVKQRVQE